MKKTIISLAAFALLTSAVPAFAQENNHVTATITNKESKNISNNSVITPRSVIGWYNSVPNASYYQVRVHNQTTNVTESVHNYSSNVNSAQTNFLTYGHSYTISVSALDANYNYLAGNTTPVFVANSYTSWSVYLY
ncbi:hypothetical protein NQ117_16620 [Paenibacillus sp. SC116]|uniref:hypothetical protein n=1 Tax=Paenibacillus sp. SC116 TaxID=2968986 RepID=UPI00215B76A2|nr:hypothetical protein [Paenibacillus sp. SC116]MCR8845309.1 hypothetical protein [Paenibacillus sp. SC116]